MGIILDGNFPGGSFTGLEFSWWILSGSELYWVGIFFAGIFQLISQSIPGNHPGGNFPGESLHVTLNS